MSFLHKKTSANPERLEFDLQQKINTYKQLLGEIDSSIKEEANKSLYDSIRGESHIENWLKLLKEAKIYAYRCQARDESENKEAQQIYSDAKSACLREVGDEFGSHLDTLATLEASKEAYKDKIADLQKELALVKKRIKLIEEIKMLKAAIISISTELITHKKEEIKHLEKKKRP